MRSISANQLLIKALEVQGAEKIFSIPGGQLLGVYEAIRESKQLELIVPRQEGASALMACGYSLSREIPGVVISTVGAGVIYELAGLIYAWQERVPVISISPQVQSWRIKPIQENLQAIDQDELYAPITKFHSIIYHYERIPQLLSRAYKIALAPEPGPVHLDFPLDILFQTKSLKSSELKKLILPAEKTRFTGKQIADPTELNKASALINQAKRPIAFLGRMMARAGDCHRALEQFLNKAKIPALSSQPGFSALSGKNEFLLGAMNLYEEASILELLREADLFLFLEPDEPSINFFQKIRAPRGSGSFIHLSSNPLLFHSFAPVDSALAGSPDLILEHLAKEIPPEPSSEKSQWLEKLLKERSRIFQSAKSVLASRRDLSHTVEMINRILSPTDFVVCQGKELLDCALLGLKNYGAGKVFLLPEDLPAGAGFPLALGIKAGAPSSRVFLLTSRKHFKYHCRELQTQARYQLGICSLIFPDQLPLAKTEPDLRALAQSFGVKARAIQEPTEEINEELLNQALELETGFLLEIRGF